MAIVLLREPDKRHPPAARRTQPSQLRSPEHANAPDGPLEALRHHRRQGSRLVDRYFRLADDLLTYLESGRAGGPREIIAAMKEAEALRRSALESVCQVSVVIAHIVQQATAGAEERGASPRAGQGLGLTGLTGGERNILPTAALKPLRSRMVRR